MKSNFKLKFQFYIISLIILFVLAIIVDYKCQLIGTEKFVAANLFSIACFAFILLGFFFVIRNSSELRGTANPCHKITKIDSANYEFLTFITTYIIPLICFNFDNTRYKVVFWILLLIIGIIFVKMDMYLANPIFALMGYHLYIIDTVDKKGIRIITRDRLSKNDSIDWIELDDTCWYVKRRKNERTRDKSGSK